MQVRQASLNNTKVSSQLGWRLSAKAGISRDISLFGTASDIIDVGGKFSRQLHSGANIEVGANLSRTDSIDAIPGVPNPSTITALDLKYRKPLQRGAGNPAYAESLQQARLDVLQAKAAEQALYDELADQVIVLFINKLNSDARIDNKRQALARSQRRKRYLADRTELGVSEKQDLLQVNAQIKAHKAEIVALELIANTQRIQLNHLMGRPSEASLNLVAANANTDETLLINDVRNNAIAHNTELKTLHARIERADSLIRLRNDDDEDVLDLVMFVGSRSLNGDTAASSVNESELIGGVSLEFQQNYDKRGSRAEIEQAMLDRDSAFVERHQLLQDIDYDSARLLADIRNGRQALQAYQMSIRSEQAKLDEAERRYRAGRTDTDQLLNFESELSAAELRTELQRIDLTDKYYQLQLLQGRIWQGVTLPDMVDDE